MVRFHKKLINPLTSLKGWCYVNLNVIAMYDYISLLRFLEIKPTNKYNQILKHIRQSNFQDICVTHVNGRWLTL